MEFDVTFRTMDEQEFRSIKSPQIPYRIKQREEERRLNRIWEKGYDRRVPLIVCSDELQNTFIVDGESRQHDILQALDAGKLQVFGDIRYGRRLAGMRIEPPIPVIVLETRSTTRMERLAISVALNTATRLDQPLELGDLIISLGSFIETKYFPNGEKIVLNEAIRLVDQVTRDTISFQLLNQFLQSNKDHKEIATRWTLQTSPENITTESEVDAMNTFEEYKVYVRCAVGFMSCATAYNIAFFNVDAEIDQCRFDAQWNLRLFSHKRFIPLEDEEKTFILLCLATRQRMWGTRGIPFTTFDQTIFLIDLLHEIYKIASSTINKDKLGKRNVPKDAFKNAILVNHPDEDVREQPYIQSIFCFMVNWKQNIRKFSKRSILKEVSKDLGNWPSKRNWRTAETKDIEWATDLCNPINRGMHAATQGKGGSRRPNSSRKRSDKNTRTEEQEFSKSVVTSLDNQNTLEKLLDMGDAIGIQKAVKKFTKNVVRKETGQQSSNSGDEYEVEGDEASGSAEVEELRVPLTMAVKWAQRIKNDGRRSTDRVAEHRKSASPINENSVEHQTTLPMLEVDRVSKVMKSLVSQESGYQNALAVLDKDSIWASCISKDETEQLKIQYQNYAVFAMEVDGTDFAKQTIGTTSRTLYQDLLFKFHKTLTVERMRSQGFVCFNEYFKDEFEDILDVYMDHYENLFDENNVKPPWKLVPSKYGDVGRYYVEFDEMSIMDSILDENICSSKLRTEIKLGMILQDIIQDKSMKFDKLGSYPIRHEEDNKGTIPMYLHEIGRYGDSKLRSKFLTKPGYQLFVTGKSRFTVIVWRHSQFHEHIPWTNRAELCKRFKRIFIHLKPYSAVVISGRMLFSFMSSTVEEEKFGLKRTTAIRLVLYDDDYDDAEDVSYVVSDAQSESDSDPSAALEDDELIALTRTHGESSSDEEQVSSSSDEGSDSEQGENSGISADTDEEETSHPRFGRKGLTVLRKNQREVAKLRTEIEAGSIKEKGISNKQPSSTAKGKEKKTSGGMKRTISKTNASGKSKRKNRRESGVPKKKPRNSS